MPIRRCRYDYQKIYRPNGMKYAEGRHERIEYAIIQAETAFLNEFGREPHQSLAVVEVVGVTGAWLATVMEIEIVIMGAG